MHKLKIWVILILSLITLNFILTAISISAPQTNSNTEYLFKTQSKIGGDFVLYKHFYEIGDFEDYFLNSGSLGEFTDTGNKLFLRQTSDHTGDPPREGLIIRQYPIYSTNLLINFCYQIRLQSYYISGTGTLLHVIMTLRYADDSTQEIYSYFDVNASNYDTGYIWINGTFTINKQFKQIEIYFASHTIQTEGYGEFTIKHELFWGYEPTIEDWAIMDEHLNIEEPQMFSTLAYNFSYLRVALQYVAAGGTTKLNLTSDWTVPDLFYAEYTFYREGLYNYYYEASNVWGVVVTTTIYYFVITEFLFPALSYLNVRSHEYRDVPEELFYVYLGESESVTLFNFKDLVGNWQTVGTAQFAFGYERIAFNCSSGGIRSDFSHIAPGRQYYLQNLTLEFDLRTTRDRLVIILNPVNYDYDYLLNISEIYKNEWITVRIPIYMFQCFSGASNAIGALGFYSNWGYYELANIKLCTYHFSTMYINYTMQTYQTDEIEAISNSSIYYYNLADNSTQQSSEIWSNQTQWINNTYDLTCQTLNTSQTSQINQTSNASPHWAYQNGNYTALYSFQNDTIGENPSTNWLTYENNPEDIEISEEKNEHNYILNVTHENGNIVYSPAFTDRSEGTVEFWMNTEDSNAIQLIQIFDTYVTNGLVFGIAYGMFMFVSNTYPTGAQIPDTPSAISNEWYHIRITFDISVGWAVSVDETYYSGLLDFYGTFYTVNSFVIWDMGLGSSQKCYYDAIDFSWADDYYLNRNMNLDAFIDEYNINCTHYFNFSAIEKPLLINITSSYYNFNYTDSFFAYSYSLYSLAGFSPAHVIGSLNNLQYYDFNTYLDIYYAQYQKPNTYFYTYFLFNTSTSTNFTQQIKLKYWFQFDEAANIKGNLSIFCWENSSYVTLLEGNNGVHNDEIEFTNEGFIHPNGTIKIAIGSGQEFVGDWNMSRVIFRYLAVSIKEKNASIYAYNFSNGVYQLLSISPLGMSFILNSDYFNATTIILRVVFSFNVSFTVLFNFTILIYYQIYQNTSYNYYYDLNDVTLHYFYNLTLDYSETVNTTVTFQWCTSNDNISWSEWSNDVIIEAYQQRYLKYKINLNTTYVYNTSNFYFANLSYATFNISYYFVQVELNTMLWQQFFINATLILNITTNANQINSSIEIYNFSSMNYENISAVQDLDYLLALNQNASSGLVLLNISIYSSNAFTLIFNESYVKAFNSEFVKYCYVNFSSNITLSTFEEVSFWYNFSDTRAFLQLQFYNDSWYTIAQLTKTPLNYGLGNASATTRLYQYWRNITLDNNYTQIRLYFTLTYPADENETMELQIKRFECIDLYDYRLESEENRQRYDILIFEQQTETLLIVDFAGREIYRQEVNYSEFIDIDINIAEVTLINYLNITAWFAFESRGATVIYGVAAMSQRNVIVLLDDYWVQISMDNLTILDVRQVSITSTNKTSIQIGDEPKDIVIPPSPGLLELLWQAIVVIFTWFFTNPWGTVVFVFLIILAAIDLYRRHKKRRMHEVEVYKQGYADGLAAAQALKTPEEKYPDYFHFRGD